MRRRGRSGQEHLALCLAEHNTHKGWALKTLVSVDRGDHPQETAKKAGVERGPSPFEMIRKEKGASQVVLVAKKKNPACQHR